MDPTKENGDSAMKKEGGIHRLFRYSNGDGKLAWERRTGTPLVFTEKGKEIASKQGDDCREEGGISFRRTCVSNEISLGEACVRVWACLTARKERWRLGGEGGVHSGRVGVHKRENSSIEETSHLLLSALKE